MAAMMADVLVEKSVGELVMRKVVMKVVKKDRKLVAMSA